MLSIRHPRNCPGRRRRRLGRGDGPSPAMVRQPLRTMVQASSVPPIPTRATSAPAAILSVWVTASCSEQAPPQRLGALYIDRGIQALGRGPRTAPQVPGRSRSGWWGRPRGTTHPWRWQKRNRWATGGGSDGGRPRIATVADRHHRSRRAGSAPGSAAALRAAASRCDSGSAWLGLTTDSVRCESLGEPALQFEVEPLGHIDVDLDDPGGTCPVEQPLHLWAGQPELVRDLALGPPVDDETDGRCGASNSCSSRLSSASIRPPVSNCSVEGNCSDPRPAITRGVAQNGQFRQA